MGFKGLYQLAASLPPHIAAVIFSQALSVASPVAANLLHDLPPKPTPMALSPSFLAFSPLLSFSLLSFPSLKILLNKHFLHDSFLNQLHMTLPFLL